MHFIINEVDWDSFEKRKNGSGLIVFCLDEVRVRLLVHSFPTDNGWQVEAIVSSVPYGQSKLILNPGDVLKGMLVKEGFAPAERNYGWLGLIV